MRFTRWMTVGGATGAAIGLVAAVGLVPVGGAGAESAIGQRCAALEDVGIVDTTVTATDVVPAADGIPAHCQVDGYVTTPGDGSVSHNEVRFQVALPAGWNGDFYFQGAGGLVGHLEPLDAGLARGYASATTDTGHQGGGELGDPSLDGSWALLNRPRQIDWAHRGVHVSTVAAKEIVEAYYGRPPHHAVFNGCSNGGRQGLMEAQRHPEDYDAIVAQAPALDPVDLIARWTWQAQAQLGAPGRWLAPEDLPVLSSATLARNDTRDGLRDGLISDPRRATFDPRSLGVPHGSLTPQQIEAVQAIYAGLTTPAGEQIVAGQQIGHEEGWASFITGGVAPTTGPDGHLVFPSSPMAPIGYTLANEMLRYFVFSDPTYQLTAFDFATDLPALDTLRPMVAATDPDLEAFQARGGKLLITQGWADPALDAAGAIRYHDEVARTLGRRTTARFFRLFMVPGMFHCGDGPGTTSYDALTAMEQWMRDGVAPTSIPASNPDTGRTRPLCPYPSTAVYRGRGSIDDAANFRCLRPEASLTPDRPRP